MSKRDRERITLLSMELVDPSNNAYMNWIRLHDPDYPWRKSPNMMLDVASIASPLYYMSLVGLVETVRCLLKNGAGVNAEGGLYGNALQAASRK